MRLARQEVVDTMIGRTARADAIAVEGMRAREAQDVIAAGREALVVIHRTSHRDAMNQRDLVQMIAAIATKLEVTVTESATLTAAAVVVAEVITTTNENANLVNLAVESETVDMAMAGVLIVLGMNLAVALLGLMNRPRDVEQLSGMVMVLGLLLHRPLHRPQMVILEVDEVVIGRMIETGETVVAGIENETEAEEKVTDLTVREDGVLDLTIRCTVDTFSSILFMLFVGYLGFRTLRSVICLSAGLLLFVPSLITQFDGYLHCLGVLSH